MTDSNRGVSPVIGVILMVAITVVLAATVAVFAFDMVGDAEDNAPNLQFSVDYEGDGNVSVTVTGGERINADETPLVVLGDDSGEICAFSGYVRASSSCRGEYTSGETIRVVWTNRPGTRDYTLRESEAPA